MNLPNKVIDIIKTIQNSNESAYLVGGSVRDLIMSITPHDYDIATSARPEKVISLFDKTIPTGIQYGTVTVMIEGESFEITTFRSDGSYGDGRRPDHITFASTIEEDLARRDFTINAMAYDPITDIFIDPFNGRADIENKIVRAVGTPHLRFQEDGLRLLRAIRFASRFGFGIESRTEKAIQQYCYMLGKISKERIRDEFVKILTSKHVEYGLVELRCCDLISYICLSANDMVWCEQNHYHDFDVFVHTVKCVSYIPDKKILRLAAFFHDIGKPESKLWDEKRGEFCFYGHHENSFDITVKAMEVLKFSNLEIEEVSILVHNHMYAYESRTNDASIRRFIKRIGKDRLGSFFSLRRADLKATRINESDERIVKDLELTDEFEKRCREQKDFVPKSTATLPVNGNDVMNILNCESGPLVGSTLKRLFEWVIEHPEDNNRDALLVKIKENK